jgi:PAS domain S-box-containing protein
MAVAQARVRAKVELPYACRASLATSAFGWPAAGYGALVIWAAGDFQHTRSGWIFGMPFVIMLALATLAGQLLQGLAPRPFLLPGATELNHALDPAGNVRTTDPAALRAALRAIGRFPVRNATSVAVFSLAVVVGCELLEWWAVGPSSPNFGVIARGGILATLLFVATSVTVNERLVRAACRALRRAALQAGLPIDHTDTVPASWRIFAAIVPPLAALWAAVEMGQAAHPSAVAYCALLALSAAIAVGLTWLHFDSNARATRDLVRACGALAAGEESQLLTGSVDAGLAEVATAFNAAARRVGADRRASSERYRALFDGASDAILLIDPASGRIVEASSRADRLFAMGRADLVGRVFADCVDDGTAQRLREFALERRERAEVALVNAAIRRPDGGLVPVDVSIGVVAAGEERVLQAILRDVRDRQRIEHELRKAARRFEELYRLAVELGDDPRALADHTVRALTALLECPMALVCAFEGDVVTVLAIEPSARIGPGHRLPIGGTPCVEVRARGVPCTFTNVGERFPEAKLLVETGMRAYCGVPILDAAGTVVGVVNVLDERDRIFHDADVQLLASFAQRIGQALARERLSCERDALTERLVASDRLKTEFLGMMSHELRTPLNILVGYTRMLLENIADGDVMTAPERRDVLERMLGGGLHLGELVEDTLSVLRLEAGVVQVDTAPLALSAFFEELRSVDRLLRRPSDVAERWRADPSVPTLVTDRRKLRQVITNLVGNARKFTDRGTIDVEAVHNRATGGVTLTVRDTGCGIGAADLPYVFDLYRQAPTERRHDGCGLGLYIVRRYVELLGGTVACTSTLGVGTTFVVELPASAAGPAVAAA